MVTDVLSSSAALMAPGLANYVNAPHKPYRAGKKNHGGRPKTALAQLSALTRQNLKSSYPAGSATFVRPDVDAAPTGKGIRLDFAAGINSFSILKPAWLERRIQATKGILDPFAVFQPGSIA